MGENPRAHHTGIFHQRLRISPRDKKIKSYPGPRAAAVPAQVVGLFEAKRRLGNDSVSWSSLVQPSVEMCLAGVEVGFSLAHNLNEYRTRIWGEVGGGSLEDVFSRDTRKRQLLKIGDKVK